MTSLTFGESPVLNDAEEILTEAGFATRRVYIGEARRQMLLAEDAFFAVGVVTARTLVDAQELESFAAAELVRRVSELNLGAKRWDAYVVVLAEQFADSPEETRLLVELQYDTRSVRRLIATGVSGRALVGQALRPLLPLPQPLPGGLADALTELIDQLRLNGIDPAQAERYVNVFSEVGNLDDV